MKMIGASFFCFTCFLWPCAWSHRWPSWRASRWTGRSHCLQTAACQSNNINTNTQVSHTLHQVTPELGSAPLCHRLRVALVRNVSNHPVTLAKGQLLFTLSRPPVGLFFFFFNRSSVKKSLTVIRDSLVQLAEETSGREVTFSKKNLSCSSLLECFYDLEWFFFSLCILYFNMPTVYAFSDNKWFHAESL